MLFSVAILSDLLFLALWLLFFGSSDTQVCLWPLQTGQVKQDPLTRRRASIDPRPIWRTISTRLAAPDALIDKAGILFKIISNQLLWFFFPPTNLVSCYQRIFVFFTFTLQHGRQRAAVRRIITGIFFFLMIKSKSHKHHVCSLSVS